MTELLDSSSCWRAVADLEALLPDSLRQIVVRKLDLVLEDVLRVLQTVRDRAGADVRVEHARIQHVNLNEGRETKLPRLQHHIEVMHLAHQLVLRPVKAKANLFAVLVDNPVKVIEPPSMVS
jgi:hypothetical protein